jgi:hypothetical protein
MNTELILQYSHIWRLFERLVTDFDDFAWLHTGRKATTPGQIIISYIEGNKILS